MPSLSTTVVKVLETCNDPQASANDLQRVISLDPVLTGRVLKLINSAYFSLDKPISSLTRAIIMLGVNTVKNLALSFSILDNLKGNEESQFFSADDFWQHSLCVGVVAKALSALIGVPVTAREEYFVAGLLHDLGKLPLRTEFPKEYYRICSSAASSQSSLYRNESRALGIDHGAVGGIIARKWRLGANLVETLSNHYRPEACADQNCEFVSTVELANQLTLQLNIGNAGDSLIDYSKMTLLMGELGVDRNMISDIEDNVSAEIERAKFFLEVVRNG